MKTIRFNSMTAEAVRHGSLSNVSGLTHYAAHFHDGTRVEYYLRGLNGNNRLFINGEAATEVQKRLFSYTK